MSGYNFYLGEYIKATNLPWHYLFIWIGITTPIFFLILFFLGIFSYIFRLVKRLFNISENLENLNDLWRGKKESEDFIFLICLTIPIMIVVLLGSPLYNGWRHLYFLYPFFILFSLRGLYLIKILFLKKKLFIFYLIVTASILNVAYTNYKYHPYQNSYFNFLAGKKPHNRFQVDTWGLSNRFVLEKLINEDKRKKISLSAISVTPLGLNFEILKPEQKSRITYSNTYENSDYIINNGAFIWGDFRKIKKLPANFDLYYELLIDDILITTIYKRNDLL